MRHRVLVLLATLTTVAPVFAFPATGAAHASGAARDVRIAQRDLSDRGYYSGPVDGVMGSHTEAALRQYQREHGLRVTGRLDSPTMHSLRTAEPSPSASPSSAIDVRTAQRALRARGYYSGSADGVIGSHTRAALRHYQRDHGLKVTGRLDAPTARRLSLKRTAAIR